MYIIQTLYCFHSYVLLVVMFISYTYICILIRVYKAFDENTVFSLFFFLTFIYYIFILLLHFCTFIYATFLSSLAGVGYSFGSER